MAPQDEILGMVKPWQQKTKQGMQGLGLPVWAWRAVGAEAGCMLDCGDCTPCDSETHRAVC